MNKRFKADSYRLPDELKRIGPGDEDESTTETAAGSESPTDEATADE